MKPYDGGYDYGVWLCEGNQQRLAELIARHQVHTVLEIGSCYGASACWFARQPGIERVTCIDLWYAIPQHGIPANIFDIFLANIEAAGVRGKIRPVVGDSHSPILRRFHPADLIYLDGDHTYEGVRQDIEMYGPIARKVLCGDDYDVNLPSVAGVIRAVDELIPQRKTWGRFWWEEK